MCLLKNSEELALVILVSLTLLSTLLSLLDQQVMSVSFIVTLTVIIKGQQIVDVFMELQQAPSKWRYLLLSYVILVPLVLAIIISS